MIDGREKIKLVVSEKIREGLLKTDISQLIVIEGKKVIQSKVKGMLKMFVTEELIDSIMEPMGDEIDQYIREKSFEKIMPVVDGEMASIEEKSVKELTQELDIDFENLQESIKNIYEDFVLNYIKSMLEKMNIAKVVEDKVNEMDVLELEKLILTVMKKELGAIVNLGALIGLILGTLNIFLR